MNEKTPITERLQKEKKTKTGSPFARAIDTQCDRSWRKFGLDFIT